MAVAHHEAFAAVHDRLAPGSEELVRGTVDASVLEAFKDVRAAAHPERIASIAAPDYPARGLLAHALFLGWTERREAAYLLEEARQHMMTQLRDQQTPNPHVYALMEALTRFCDAWRRQIGEDDF
ncbi:MAG: hypothetical protein PVH40_04035 [Gemmatimonadales bacterium]|jgi:hypothetical protein